ncbi:hypothetical protein B0I72DRAFT_101020 [Yarrowia lipolytica]|jgi:hypothetical protein|uniref:YALI0B08690p n=2 Tax=Yarrowia lipolytica TaxID=4952 RepID=Q6CFB3_YARLI|nr:YALI0B08690p [Yarrowia lipolytica CLIB122]AOW01425.1 hypothetical protein YALI1_B11681g [Yarrowia lipolytica]KAB8281642.1 hypothetical protein BKA91DRAFT_139846 [Yarrowia lipolytica]KAE8171353.1 hypothetical protein BKA90DRAFT_139223 [Yarrowia lipolytica]KAJ8052251.1 hypothetical protein LXG23DRAFT_24741 [Yarrowia lipolytica]QNP97258.1 Hypothetical protein YALI2_C00911g [Yarrowia lipolytica]|eukprot:XP_500649.1 YALI0B08690p [Yarrowia lipolytica CLIB122]
MTSILGKIQNQLEYRKVTSKYIKRRPSAVKLHNDEYNHSATSLDDDYGYHDRTTTPKSPSKSPSSPKRSPLKPPSTSYFLEYEPGFDRAREGNGRTASKASKASKPAMKRADTYSSSHYDNSRSSSVYSINNSAPAYDPPKTRSHSTGSFNFTPSTRHRSGTNASRNSNNPWADSLPEEKPETSHSEHMSQQELFDPNYLDFLATKKAPPPPPVSHHHSYGDNPLADDTDNLTTYHSREEDRGRYNTEGVTDRYDAFDEDGYGQFSRVKTRQSQGNLKKLGRRLSLFRN